MRRFPLTQKVLDYWDALASGREDWIHEASALLRYQPRVPGLVLDVMEWRRR